MYNQYNKDNIELQVLKDVNSSGKEVNWKEKYLSKQGVVDSYFRIGTMLKHENYLKKSIKVLECGSTLLFKRYLVDNKIKLHRADFCKDRLCPMCSWRRSLKVYGQVSKVMDKLQEEHPKYRYVFLTLTARNVIGEDLNEYITHLFQSWNRFNCNRKIKASIKGWFRAFEVTHNMDNDTYHPHFHVILVVNSTYFSKKNEYITQSLFTDIWGSALQVDYKPIVNVKVFKADSQGSLRKSVAEVAKYTFKNSDLIVPGDYNYTDSIVMTVDDALYKRRLSAFGGVMKEIKKQLQLDDVVDGDLVNTHDDEIRDDINFVIEKYCWSVGYNNYIRK